MLTKHLSHTGLWGEGGVWLKMEACLYTIMYYEKEQHFLFRIIASLIFWKINMTIFSILANKCDFSATNGHVRSSNTKNFPG